MSAGPDPITELTQLLERSRQLLGQLRSLESRVEQVARRISDLSSAQQKAHDQSVAKSPPASADETP